MINVLCWTIYLSRRQALLITEEIISDGRLDISGSFSTPKSSIRLRLMSEITLARTHLARTMNVWYCDVIQRYFLLELWIKIILFVFINRQFSPVSADGARCTRRYLHAVSRPPHDDARCSRCLWASAGEMQSYAVPWPLCHQFGFPGVESHFTASMDILIKRISNLAKSIPWTQLDPVRSLHGTPYFCETFNQSWVDAGQAS